MFPFFSALVKSTGLRIDGRIDDRSFWIGYVSSASTPLAIPLVHPRMISIHDLDTQAWFILFCFVNTTLNLALNQMVSFYCLTGGKWISSPCNPAFQWTREWWWNFSPWEWSRRFNIHWELCGFKYLATAIWHFLHWWNPDSSNLICPFWSYYC